jgi:hypothetical protein
MSELPDLKPEAHRRQHPRLRLGIPARLESLDGNESVRLIDLSQSGAHVVLAGPHDLRRAVLCWLGFEAFGFVAWREGDHVGMEFEELVPMEQLFETRQRAPDVVRAEILGDYGVARDFVAGTFNPGD